jgi:hypothetical protein
MSATDRQAFLIDEGFSQPLVGDTVRLFRIEIERNSLHIPRKRIRFAIPLAPTCEELAVILEAVAQQLREVS